MLLAYGGREETFERLEWPDRCFIADGRLRTRDHQRERQSYRGVMSACAERLAGTGVRRVLLAECDVAPLRPGLTERMERLREEEGADMLGVHLRRVDGTGHPHFLAHQSHPRFKEWLARSVRTGEEREVVLMMIGCLSWWTWEAFRETAAAPEPMPVYLELAMPTTAHHLGFRVREARGMAGSMFPLGDLTSEIDQWRKRGFWALHPCKNCWNGSTGEAFGEIQAG